MPLSQDLLAILVCPKCRGDLAYDAQGATLSCSACRLRYAVVEDIPVLLIDQAQSF